MAPSADHVMATRWQTAWSLGEVSGRAALCGQARWIHLRPQPASTSMEARICGSLDRVPLTVAFAPGSAGKLSADTATAHQPLPWLATSNSHGARTSPTRAAARCTAAASARRRHSDLRDHPDRAYRM